MDRTVIVLLALTVLAGGGGAVLGLNLTTLVPGLAIVNSPETKTSEEKAAIAEGHGDDSAHHKGKSGDHGGESQQAASGKLQLKELPPIVTNLASPESKWVRIQVSIVYDPKTIPHSEALTAELMSDIVGYLRTVSLPSIEGANGLRRLQEELSDRASIRSEGAIREFIIQSLVVQ
jgi:flagellar basal body-associated protein FliL